MVAEVDRGTSIVPPPGDDDDVRSVIADGRSRWERRFAVAQAAGRVRDADFTTLSGMTVDPVYGPAPGDVVTGLRADRLAR